MQSSEAENLPVRARILIRPVICLQLDGTRRFVSNFLRKLAGTMTPRQTIRLSGVISCARHERLGQRLAVNSFTVVLAQVHQTGPVKVNDFPSHSARQLPPSRRLLAKFISRNSSAFGATIPMRDQPSAAGIWHPGWSEAPRAFTQKEHDMTNRIFITVLLSIGLALSAFAQQTTSSSSTQPATSANQSAPSSQPLTASGDEPLQSPKPPDFWDGDEPSLTWLVLHPFASKQYVRRHVQPIQDRVNELDEITADNGRTIREVDTRAQKGIQMVSAKTSLADEHARDADNKAQMAHQTVASLGHSRGH